MSHQIIKLSQTVAELQEQVAWLLEQKQRDEERAWSIQALEEAKQEKGQRKKQRQRRFKEILMSIRSLMMMMIFMKEK